MSLKKITKALAVMEGRIVEQVKQHTRFLEESEANWMEFNAEVQDMHQWHDWVHQTWSQYQEVRAEDQHYVGRLKSMVNIPNTNDKWAPPLYIDDASTPY